MIVPSSSHLVLIPSYNTGNKVLETAREARRFWEPVWIVVDGSTDGTAAALRTLEQRTPGIKVLVLPENRGKGAAVLHGLREAAAAGFTHALTMDADGQHPADKIPEFMAASQDNTDAQILGMPVFDATAPKIRIYGRKLSNALACVQTLGGGIGDTLYGFRVYPIAPLREIMEKQRWMRSYDFDPEAAVRLCWRGIRPINMKAPVKYFLPEEGGVSHFKYLRHNALLAWMNLRLSAEFVLRLPGLIRARTKKR